MSVRWPLAVGMAVGLAGCGAAPRQDTSFPVPAVAPPVRPPPPAPPSVVVAGDLLPGTECSTAALPIFQYERKENLARLSEGDFKVRLPPGWTAQIERPALLVVSAPETMMGVRSVFEVFVSPLCATYQGPIVHERVAARGLIALLPQEVTVAQVAHGRWSAEMGGSVGMTISLHDVTLTTPNGERVVALFSTEMGESKTYGVHAAAVCPKERAKDKGPGPCEETYFAMLKSRE